MKFDIKNILILILLLASTIFGFMWFLGGNDVSKEKIKQLETEYKKLEHDKAAADVKISQWQLKYQEADKKDKEMTVQILKLKSESKIAEEKAKKSKVDLDKVQNGIAENRREIDELRKTPPILGDDELLESLTKKLNK